MSDANGFLVAAYTLTAATLAWYSVRVVLRARGVERRLVAARERLPAADRQHTPRGGTGPDSVGGTHV